MDSSLLREREEFKRKAMALPAVEARSSAKKQALQPSSKKPAAQPSAKERLDYANLKHLSSSGGGSSQFRFGVLARIVRHMRQRHMEGEDQALTLEEILDETKQLDVGAKTKAWLTNEALKSNPRISTDGATYLYRAPYNIPNKKGLLRLLRTHDLKGWGGILLDDIQESLPKSEKVIRVLTEEDKIVVISRGADKKKVVFYKDHEDDFEIDEEFQKLWRSVPVDGVDERKIDEYLDKQGIKSMQDQGPRKIVKKPVRRKPARRKPTVPKDNEHLKDVLEDYEGGLTADKGKK